MNKTTKSKRLKTVNDGACEAYDRVRKYLIREIRRRQRGCDQFGAAALTDALGWVNTHDQRNRRKGGLGRK